MAFCVDSEDSVNSPEPFREWFHTLDDAVNYVFTMFLYESEPAEKDVGYYVFRDETQNKLFRSSSKDRFTGEYNQLFRDYTDNMPRTMDELRQYIRDRHLVIPGWATREGFRIQILTKEEAQQKDKKRAVEGQKVVVWDTCLKIDPKVPFQKLFDSAHDDQVTMEKLNEMEQQIKETGKIHTYAEMIRL